MPQAAPKTLLALALAATVAIAGCGSSKKDEKQVRRTVTGLYAALAARDSGRFCASLTTELRREVSRRSRLPGKPTQSCERVLGYILTFAGRGLTYARHAKVVHVAVDGDKATALVQQPGKDGGVELTKENGAWKVSNFNLKKL